MRAEAAILGAFEPVVFFQLVPLLYLQPEVPFTGAFADFQHFHMRLYRIPFFTGIFKRKKAPNILLNVWATGPGQLVS
jgi:hypothetical protein